MTIFSRTAVPFFNLSNKIYAGATVTLYTVDAYGVKTATTATLYSSVSGSSTLSNPQTLDSRGMFPNPVYIETPVICTVSGLNLIADHDTGIVSFIEEYSDIAADAAAAATSAAEALVSETNAAASEATAADYAAAMTATSTTAITISTGAASFTIETGKIFKTGQTVVASSDADPTTDWMLGQITSHNATTGALVVDVDMIGGSGSHADWTIALSGPHGATGPKGDTGAGTGDMLAAQNLNDVADKPTARANLGLKSAAVVDTIDEDDMASDSHTKVPFQHNIVEYVADQLAAATSPHGKQLFLSSGTFTVPAGVTTVYISGSAGGGGGGAPNKSSSGIIYSGTAGGATSFGALVSLAGGVGGQGSPGNLSTHITTGAGNTGGPGYAIVVYTSSQSTVLGSVGGAGGGAQGGASVVSLVGTTLSGKNAATNSGDGGGGGAEKGAGGAGGACGTKLLPTAYIVTPGATYAVTIGAGGLGGAPSPTSKGGDGGAGWLLVEW